VKPTPDRQTRIDNAVACKRLARLARSTQRVKLEAVAAALHLQIAQTKRLFYDDAGPYQFTYGDLFLLARDPETAAMARDMLAPLLELIDPKNLRLSDLEGLASSSTTAHTALAYLRPMFERLGPLMGVTPPGGVGEVER